MATKRKNQPQRIGVALTSVLDELDREGHFALFRLVRIWPEVVGEDIARHTEISGLKFHTLVVKVSNAMWIQELSMMSRQILRELTARLGDDSVRNLRFVKGALSRRRAPNRNAPHRLVRRSVALPELKDPQLRAAFDSLIEAWGRSPR